MFWLLGWTIAGSLAAYAWIWIAFGREIVRLDGATLSVSRAPIPVPRRRDFDWQQVRNLRVAPRASWTRRKTLLASEGAVAFDYGARTYHFGDVDEAEAAMLIDELERRFGTRSGS